MAEISASTVAQLRKMSGQGMMDCKNALKEANGDIEQALGILRKKGLATLSKRAARETSEGVVVSKTTDDGKVAVLATLCCETDFVSRSDDFVAVAEKLADYALACSVSEGPENLLETNLDGKEFNQCLTELVSKTGEKTQVGDYAKYTFDGPGLIVSYIHFNQKVGTMIQIETGDEKVAASDRVKHLANDLAMHITAINPLALDKDGIDAEIIEREKAIFADQAKDKPANIIEKIVQGKLNKFLAEKCLLNQQFVKDDSKSVAEVVAAAAQEAGGDVKIKRFVRFGVG